jgi:hypothetical protein
MKQRAKEINSTECFKETDRFIFLHLQIANRERNWSGFLSSVPSVFNTSYYGEASITEKPILHVRK